MKKNKISLILTLVFIINTCTSVVYASSNTNSAKNTKDLIKLKPNAGSKIENPIHYEDEKYHILPIQPTEPNGEKGKVEDDEPSNGSIKNYNEEVKTWIENKPSKEDFKSIDDKKAYSEAVKQWNSEKPKNPIATMNISKDKKDEDKGDTSGKVTVEVKSEEAGKVLKVEKDNENKIKNEKNLKEKEEKGISHTIKNVVSDISEGVSSVFKEISNFFSNIFNK